MEKKISHIRFLLHNHTFLKNIFYHFFTKKFENPILQTNYSAKKYFNYSFDCRNPRTFNEWICWLKFNYRNELWEKCADKLYLKEFLTDVGLSEFVPKTYAIYKKSEEIKLDKLPDKFVLKTNNDSGTVFVCEKGKTDFSKVFPILDLAVEKKYSSNNYEWVYDNIEPRIFAEEFLHPEAGMDDLVDFKFFLYKGKLIFGFTAQNRFKDVRFNLFDENYNSLDSEYIYLKPKKSQRPLKPKCWDRMIEISKIIGEHFNFVRADFYASSKGIMIGEFTYFSQSGFGPFTNQKLDFEMGRFFTKSDFKINIAK